MLSGMPINGNKIYASMYIMQMLEKIHNASK